jgi:hypothetical protein
MFPCAECDRGPDDQELGSGTNDKQDGGGITALHAQPHRNVRPVRPEARVEFAEPGPGGRGGRLAGVFGYDTHDVEFGVPQPRLRDGPP